MECIYKSIYFSYKFIKGNNLQEAEKMTKLSVVFICIIIIIAQFVSPVEYRWKSNTISELASQGYNHKAIMQIGFIGFGFLLSLGLIVEMYHNKKINFLYVPIILYALSIMITGFFSAQPFLEGVEYSKYESMIHSIFATVAGFSLSLGVVMYFIKAETMQLKIIHFSYLLFITGVSLLFGMFPDYQGLIQRILYLGSFTWILFFM